MIPFFMLWPRILQKAVADPLAGLADDETQPAPLTRLGEDEAEE